MPAVTPLEFGPGMVVRHAVSQGYVLYRAQLSSVPPTGGMVWVPVDEMTMNVEIDEPSTVLQILRCTVFLSGTIGRQLELRLRHGAQTSVHQTAERDSTIITGMDGDGVTLFRAWPDVQPGTRAFGLDVRFPYSSSWTYSALLANLRHSLAILKR